MASNRERVAKLLSPPLNAFTSLVWVLSSVLSFGRVETKRS